jgi:lipid II:glycine glycyltransferase (peptidoglycan interpeptide bridge formation enzyme)
LAAELKTLALHHRALAVKLDPALDHTNELAHRALLGQGFNPVSSDEAVGGVQPKHVMKLDLTSSLDDLLASFHSKWRYNIRYAARQGVEVTADTTRADIEPFYRLLQETASRDGFTVRALSYFYDLWDILVERGMGRLFLAHADGQLLAGTLAFLLPPQAWYVYGASSNEKRNLMPNHAIQWAMIQWAHDNGCTTYDFRGVAPQIDGEPQGPLAGLNRFKAGFNAHYVEYLGEYEWVARPLSHWAFRKALPWVRARGRRHRRAESED